MNLKDKSINMFTASEKQDCVPKQYSCLLALGTWSEASSDYATKSS